VSIGYDEAAKVAHYALDNDLAVKQAALRVGFGTEGECASVDPEKMAHPHVAKCQLGG
jgi:fumarate hydratase class II